uniref:VOC domain-containing protein n=2 Tax=Brassica oleracea var. oleracea TaxID=109376 RepID=A0A0D3DPS9_BRAOL
YINLHHRRRRCIWVVFLLIGGIVAFCFLEVISGSDEGKRRNPLHLTSLNHVSLLCRSIGESMNFYQNVLGFFPIRRPESLNFEGAWLFGHGIGIHLLRALEREKLPKKNEINPKDNHISFQCESMGAVEKKLEEMEIDYVRSKVEEGEIQVDQLFFHDPDGFMIEICNCDSLPIVPLVGGMVRSCSRVKLHQLVQPQPQTQINQVVHP